jgi:hypothetical protein
MWSDIRRHIQRTQLRPERTHSTHHISHLFLDLFTLICLHFGWECGYAYGLEALVRVVGQSLKQLLCQVGHRRVQQSEAEVEAAEERVPRGQLGGLVGAFHGRLQGFDVDVGQVFQPEVVETHYHLA